MAVLRGVAVLSVCPGPAEGGYCVWERPAGRTARVVVLDAIAGLDCCEYFVSYVTGGSTLGRAVPGTRWYLWNPNKPLCSYWLVLTLYRQYSAFSNR